MSPIALPCPDCAHPLILDKGTAGKEISCPDCHARLQMPAEIRPGAAALLLPKPEEAAPKKAVLPQARTRTAEEERKRLLGAAAAAGGPHALPANEVVLPADHQRTHLPSKRTPVTPAAADAQAEPSAAPKKPGIDLPTPKLEVVPSANIQPIIPEADPEFSGTPLRGPSRFVRPVDSTPEATDPATSAAANRLENNSPEDTENKGGFRLGAKRSLHFSPIHTITAEEEAPSWGASEETPRQAAFSRRFIFIALIIALIAAGSAVFFTLRQAFSSQDAARAAGDDGTSGRPPSENVMANVEAARIVLKRFLAADTVEKMAAEVRHPEITRPRMDRYYATTPPKRRTQRSESQAWNEIQIADKEFIRAGLELDDFRIYPVNLEIISGGEPKIDWESFVDWAELPWKDFLKTPPEQAIDYRVTLSSFPEDQYYNYYSKGRELDLMCFKIGDPGKFGSCWAYCHKDSDAAFQILFQLKQARTLGNFDPDGKLVISCILQLRFPPEGMKSNQVNIEKFIYDSWLVP